MRRLLIRVVVAILLTITGVAPVFAQAVQQFQTQQQAQEHCPQDTIVWLNTNSGVYHFQGQRWYGNTKSGAYVCQQEADKDGDRATRNGQ